MKIGIGLPNNIRNVDPAVIPGWAAQAEQAGFSTLGTVGRNAYPGVMDTVALAAAAGATSTIGLFTGVLLAPTWPAALLAKEIASVDGVSNGRLTLGVGIGAREDDFVAEGYGPRARGERFDRDLETYHEIWRGAKVGGGENAAVPEGTREVPLMFGALSPKAIARMARWGQGYVGASIPPQMASSSFDTARAAWKEAGREGEPRLTGLGYFSLVDGERARANVRDYYSVTPDFVDIVVGGVSVTAADVRDVVKQYDDLGVDELLLNPGTDDPTEIARLAEIVF